MATMDSMIGELLVKSSHIILQARNQQAIAQSRKANGPVAKTWGNLDTPEVQFAARELEPWKTRITLPLVLEIYLQSLGPQSSGGAGEAQQGEVMLERWNLQYTSHSAESVTEGTSGARASSSSVYKRMVIALRALYSYVRVLPAYRLHRACKRDHQHSFSMRYRIAPAASPDVRCGATGRLQTFSFSPISTPDGTFSMSVAHQPVSAVRILEQTTAPPSLSSRVIPDYLGRVGAPHRSHGPLARRSSLSASLHCDVTSATVTRTALSPAGIGSNTTPWPALEHQSTTVGDTRPPLVRRHSWSLQGRAAAAAAASGRPPSGGKDAPSDVVSSATSLSPSPVVRKAAVTGPVSARSGSTPPRHPSSLSPLTSGGLLSRIPSSGLPPTMPRGGQQQRLSPSETNGANSTSCLPPLPSSDRHADRSPQQDPQHCLASNNGRQASAPVCIPQRGRAAASQRCSVDLTAAYSAPCRSTRGGPSSAPEPTAPAASSSSRIYPHAARSPGGAASQAALEAPQRIEDSKGRPVTSIGGTTPFGKAHPFAQPGSISSQGTGSSAPVTPQTPATARASAPFGSSYGGSSASVGFAVGGSPQLPFAVTPTSSHPLASLAATDQQQGSPWIGGPSPPMTGRRGGALAAVRRAPSWAAQSLTGGFLAAAAAFSASPRGGRSLTPRTRGQGLTGAAGGGYISGSFPRTRGFAAPVLTDSPAREQRSSKRASDAGSIPGRCDNRSSSSSSGHRDSGHRDGPGERTQSGVVSSHGSCSDGLARHPVVGCSLDGDQGGVASSGVSARHKSLSATGSADGEGSHSYGAPSNAAGSIDYLAMSVGASSEQLPFALDEEEAAAEGTAASSATEAAVAAFVQMLDAAPPLRSPAIHIPHVHYGHIVGRSDSAPAAAPLSDSLDAWSVDQRTSSRGNKADQDSSSSDAVGSGGGGGDDGSRGGGSGAAMTLQAALAQLASLQQRQAASTAV